MPLREPPFGNNTLLSSVSVVFQLPPSSLQTCAICGLAGCGAEAPLCAYADGNAVSMTVAGQTQVTYTYDNANELTEITQSAASVAFTYGMPIAAAR